MSPSFSSWLHEGFFLLVMAALGIGMIRTIVQWARYHDSLWPRPDAADSKGERE